MKATFESSEIRQDRAGIIFEATVGGIMTERNACMLVTQCQRWANQNGSAAKVIAMQALVALSAAQFFKLTGPLFGATRAEPVALVAPDGCYTTVAEYAALSMRAGRLTAVFSHHCDARAWAVEMAQVHLHRLARDARLESKAADLRKANRAWLPVPSCSPGRHQMP